MSNFMRRKSFSVGMNDPSFADTDWKGQASTSSATGSPNKTKDQGQTQGHSWGQKKKLFSGFRMLSRTASEVTPEVRSRGTRYEKYKVVLFGASKVGKSSFLQQMSMDQIPENYKPLGDLYEVTFDVQGSTGQVRVEMIDTSADEAYPAMDRLLIRSADGFILIYAVNDPASYEQLEVYRKLIETERATCRPDSQTLMVIAANKSDLLADTSVLKVAEGLAMDWEVGFAQCSAKTGDNVIEVLFQLLLQGHSKGGLQDSLLHFVGNPCCGPDGGRLKLRKQPWARNQRQRRRRSSLPAIDLLGQSHSPAYSGGISSPEHYPREACLIT